LYKLDATYAATAARDDVVKLNASGEVILAAAADTAVLGVLETIEIKGQGETTTYGHVSTHPHYIFEAPVTGGTAGQTNVGKAYGITATNGGTVDLANTTNTCVKVVGFKSNGNVEVLISGRQLV
jgi:hypothetical protein